MKGFRSALLIVTLSVLPVAARAQQVTSASINGTVTDESRATLPGVTVTATSPSLQVPQLVNVTDEEGRYLIRELPVGTYTLTFELTGFGTVRRAEIVLTSGFAARVDVAMGIGQLQETITVTGQSPLIDVSNTRGGNTLTKDSLQAIPTNRTYQDIQSLTPGMVVTTPPAPGGLGLSVISGGFKTYGLVEDVTTSIEGIDMRQSDVPDLASVEEVDAKTFGNTAEVATAGAAIQLIVKSGGNDFHGRYKEEAMSDHVQSNNVDDNLRANGIKQVDGPVYYQDFSGDLGGRIIRDKLWFYGALRDQHNQRTQSGYALDPGPDGKYLTSDDVPDEPKVDQRNQTIKVSYQASPHQKFIGFHSWNHIDEQEFMGARLVPHESAMTWDYTLYAQKLEWQSTIGSRVFLSVMGASSGSHSWYYSHSTNPARLDLESGLSTGESFNTLANRSRNPKRKQLNATLSYIPQGIFGGSHELKAGYTLWRRGYEHGGTAGKGDVKFNRDSGNYQLQFDSGVPSRIATLNNPLDTPADSQYTAGYFSDTWRASRRLTVNVGARVEHESAWVDAVQKEAGEFAAGGFYPKLNVGPWNVWAVRSGLAYDVTGNGKTVAKATYGKYDSILEYSNAAAYSPLASVTTTYRWHDLNGDNRYQTGEVNLSLDGPDFLSIAGNSTLDPSRIVPINVPYSHEATASVEHELTSSLAVRGLYIFKRKEKTLELVNVARPYSAYSIASPRRDPGADGVLGTADDPGTMISLYTYGPEWRGSQFENQQYVNRDSSRDDYSNSLEFAAKRRMANRWSFEGSYMATKSHNWRVGYASSPNDDIFALDSTWEWAVRAAGSYELPRRVILSAFYTATRGQVGQRDYLFRSADPDGKGAALVQGNVRVPVEPFGSQHGPARTNLNLRISKRVSLGARRTLGVDVDIVNVLNTNVPWRIQYQSGTTFGIEDRISPPRAARFGVVLDF